MRATRLVVLPDVVTYSTLVKAYCVLDDFLGARALLPTMIDEDKIKPDEILFNCLLDGCKK